MKIEKTRIEVSLLTRDKKIQNQNRLTRRSFMGWGGVVLVGFASLATFLVTLSRMLFPSLRPGKSGRVAETARWPGRSNGALHA